jgi:uncharacterized membrane protein
LTSKLPEDNIYLSTHRLESFSDGVFAIAITLLILQFKVPDAADLAHQSLTSYLINLWPNCFAYVFSFIIIGIYWANHHYIFKLYVKTDHLFNVMNVLFLLTIAFLPFPSALFGEYINNPSQRKVTVVFYSIGIFLPALTWFIMWLYASHKKRLVDPRLDDQFIERLTKQFLLSNLLYLAAIGISLVSPLASLALSILLTLVYLLPPKKPKYS